MSIRATFDQELQDLRDNVLRLGSMVDTAISQSIQALKERDQELGYLSQASLDLCLVVSYDYFTTSGR